MNTLNETENRDSLNKIFEKIQEIAIKSAASDCIYRGEVECFDKVSSSLWRECHKEIGSEDFDVEAIQKQILQITKDYTHGRVVENEEDKFEILTELQHYEGFTNLIDFTIDCNIALFFACDGALEKHGRIILLEKTEEIKDYTKPPQNPQNRIVAQKSIFVRPPKGFLEELYTVINIPGTLKEPMLDYLYKTHGISTPTVYNDLQGFIRNQKTHLKEAIEVYNTEIEKTENDFQVESS